MNTTSRIQVLDGLRVIAILMVMLYHFYPRFEGYAYSYSFEIPEIFNHGKLGVPLFFVISGFVINLTLNHSYNFVDFMKKRLIRLMPGMLLCSTTTFLTFYYFDTQDLIIESKQLGNLLLSNTFIIPNLFNWIFNTKWGYVDGAYWSLWVELQFYVIIGALYFISSKYLLRNFTLVTIVGVFFYHLFYSAYLQNHIPDAMSSIYRAIHLFFVVANIFKYGLWFLAGVLSKEIYFERRSLKLLMSLCSILFAQSILAENFYESVFALLVLAILLAFCYRGKMLSFLHHNWLVKVGISSYAIYLIHENIGVLIINKTIKYFGVWDWILPFIVITFATVFGLLSYKYFEYPFGRLLKRFLLSRKADPRAVEKRVSSTHISIHDD